MEEKDFFCIDNVGFSFIIINNSTL